MSDAPRLVPIDELNKRITHAALFNTVKSRTLKPLLQEALQRMNGFGEDAEPKYQQALAAVREAEDDAIDALAREFAALGQEDYINRWGVVQLLHDLQDPRALSLLDRIIAAPMPAEGSRDPHGSAAGREVVIRTDRGGSRRASRRGWQHRRARCALEARASPCTIREDRGGDGVSRAGRRPGSQSAPRSHGEVRSLDGRHSSRVSSRVPGYRGASVPTADVTARTGQRTATCIRRCWSSNQTSISFCRNTDAAQCPDRSCRPRNTT